MSYAMGSVQLIDSNPPSVIIIYFANVQADIKEERYRCILTRISLGAVGNACAYAGSMINMGSNCGSELESRTKYDTFLKKSYLKTQASCA